MSEMTGMTAGGGIASTKPSNTGRAILLLAIAVVIGVALLHELDNGNGEAALSSKPAATATQPTVAPSTSTTLALRSPAEVKVLVANGVGVAGAASKVAGRLQPIGYQLGKPGNTTNKETVSAVQYVPGYQAEAMALATSLGLPSSAVTPLPNPAPVADMQGSSVLVIIGNDLAATGVANGATTQSGNATSPNGEVTNPLTNGPLTTNTTIAGQMSTTTAPTTTAAPH